MSIFGLKRLGLGLCAVAGAGVILLSGAPNVEPFLGRPVLGPFSPRLIDGDTFADGDTRIRLAGVDACEMGQPIRYEEYAAPLDCGAYAKAFVERFIGTHPVVCYDQGGHSYGRIVARCFLDIPGRGHTMKTDIGAFALRSGWAFPSHPHPAFGARYALEHLRAMIARAGALAGRLDKPRDWRRTGRRVLVSIL